MVQQDLHRASGNATRAMALAFEAKHKSTSVFDMDQLRLKRDEKARILLLDKQVQMMYCHYIMQAPDQEGRTRGRYYACLGDVNVVGAEAVDVRACPACRVATPGRDVAVAMPRRRFVMHVARYNANSRGQLARPLSLSMVAWVFSDDKFNKLVDRVELHQGEPCCQGDLRKHDLMLTCTAEQFQSVDIDMAPSSEAFKDKAAQEQYKELLKRKSPEISRLLAQTVSYEQLETLVSNATPQITEAALSSADASSTIEEIASTLDLDGDDDPFAPVAVAAGQASVGDGSDVEGAVSFDNLLDD